MFNQTLSYFASVGQYQVHKSVCWGAGRGGGEKGGRGYYNDAVNKEFIKMPMKRKLSFSYLNELLKLLGLLIWSSFIFHIVPEIFRLMWYANDLTCNFKRYTLLGNRIYLWNDWTKSLGTLHITTLRET